MSLFVILHLTFPGCAILRQVSDPLTGTIKRGSCFSIDIPPITLTPERTAAENQLLGENKEIEKGGWLIASSQYGDKNLYTDTSQRTAKRVALQQLQRERATLEFYKEFLNEYLNEGYLGEDYSGILIPVPEHLSKINTATNISHKTKMKEAQNIAREVNMARRWIYEYYISHERSSNDSDNDLSDIELIKENFLYHYWNEAPRGAWTRDKNKVWSRKK